jgi:formylglycine-generating enzyme required for sulfatase activity
MRAAILAFLFALASAPFTHAQGCIGDVAMDGKVDGGDLGLLLANWGSVTPTALSHACDIDDDGRVDGADLGSLLSNWGACPAGTWSTVIDFQPDPSVVAASSSRTAIIATGYPWRVWDRNTGIEMLVVPPGTFQMGCIMGSNGFGCYSAELPVRQVMLTNSFYLGRYEVTQAQWQARMGTNPSFFQGPSSQVPVAEVPRRPVERVSWNNVQNYLNSSGMRLPTEAEWEYACRAGTQTPYFNGSTDDSTVGALAWYSPNSGGQTRPVGGRAPNALGFHDMLGNVYEYVKDWYGLYPSSAQTNPAGPLTGTYRVARGGSFDCLEPDFVRSSHRNNASPSNLNYSFGFRVARNP